MRKILLLFGLIQIVIISFAQTRNYIYDKFIDNKNKWDFYSDNGISCRIQNGFWIKNSGETWRYFLPRKLNRINQIKNLTLKASFDIINLNPGKGAMGIALVFNEHFNDTSKQFYPMDFLEFDLDGKFAYINANIEGSEHGGLGYIECNVSNKVILSLEIDNTHNGRTVYRINNSKDIVLPMGFRDIQNIGVSANGEVEFKVVDFLVKYDTIKTYTVGFKDGYFGLVSFAWKQNSSNIFPDELLPLILNWNDPTIDAEHFFLNTVASSTEMTLNNTAYLVENNTRIYTFKYRGHSINIGFNNTPYQGRDAGKILATVVMFDREINDKNYLSFTSFLALQKFGKNNPELAPFSRIIGSTKQIAFGVTDAKALVVKYLYHDEVAPKNSTPK